MGRRKISGNTTKVASDAANLVLSGYLQRDFRLRMNRSSYLYPNWCRPSFIGTWSRRRTLLHPAFVWSNKYVIWTHKYFISDCYLTSFLDLLGWIKKNTVSFDVTASTIRVGIKHTMRLGDPVRQHTTTLHRHHPVIHSHSWQTQSSQPLLPGLGFPIHCGFAWRSSGTRPS